MNDSFIRGNFHVHEDVLIALISVADYDIMRHLPRARFIFQFLMTAESHEEVRVKLHPKTALIGNRDLATLSMMTSLIPSQHFIVILNTIANAM